MKTVAELADQLCELVRTGHGDSEVRLRASYGEHIMVRSGVDGIQRELHMTLEGDRETILLWGRSA